MIQPDRGVRATKKFGNAYPVKPVDLGLCFGAALGAALHNLGVGSDLGANAGVGIALGASLGVVFGAALGMAPGASAPRKPAAGKRPLPQGKKEVLVGDPSVPRGFEPWRV